MKCAFACGLVLFVSGMRILAQNPSELARSYLETLQAGKYDDVSAFFAADELKEFRATFDFGEALLQEAAQQFYLMLFGEGATKSSVHKLSDTQFLVDFYHLY